jgi:hypothetical protein
VAWFPPRLKQFFASTGIDQCTVRFGGERPIKERELERFVRLQWSVELPRSSFIEFGAALARLENEQPFRLVDALAIKNLEDPEFQRILLGVRILRLAPR